MFTCSKFPPAVLHIKQCVCKLQTDKLRCVVGRNALCTRISKFCLADNTITTSKWMRGVGTGTIRFLNNGISMDCLRSEAHQNC
jgi:hypothetical protein